ncbi:MAG TPA: NUDIX domain-containing protein [Bacteroidia bacterium]|jgi:8-oxo-dGTP diphosphatase
MDRKNCYEYPRPALTTDCVIFGFGGNGLKVLLVEREKEPFKNKWALPGGFVHENENAEESAERVLLEKTGMKNVFIEQLYTFTQPDRDPREWIVSVTYFALVNNRQLQLITGRDIVKAEWFGVGHVPRLAFDHNNIVKKALERLRGKVRYQPIGFELLDEKFTLTQLQQLYEAVLGTVIDKRNFRKKILGMGLLKALNEKEKNVGRRAARYFSFDRKAYKKLTASGFNFEI